jgi:hypothetical protein
VADRELRFDVNANDRASGAFGRIAAAAEVVANRIAKLDGKRARVRVEADTSEVQRKITEVEARLDRLRREKASPKLDADTALVRVKITEVIARLQDLRKTRADAQVGLDRAEAVKAEIAQIIAALKRVDGMRASPRIRAYTDEAKARLAELLVELKALDAEKPDIKLDVDIARAEAQLLRLQAELERLQAESANPKVDLDIAAAEAKLLALKAQLESMRREKVEVKVDTDRGFTSILSSLNDVRHGFASTINSVALFSRSLRQITLGPGLLSLAPTLIGITAAAQTAVGALNVLPGAISVAGLMFGTLAIGFSGFKDALGKMDTAAQVKKVNKALSLMGDGARRTALEIRAMGPAWNSVKAATQNALFNGLSGTIKELGEKYLPLLKSGFSETATAFNGAWRGFQQFLVLPNTLEDVNRLFNFTTATVAPFGAAITNIAAAFKDMAVVGGSFMPGLAQSFANVTDQFRKFISTARDDGRLQNWIARGMAQLQEFGGLLANVGGIFGGVFDAIEKSGQGVVTTMRLATQAMESWVKSGQGQAGLIALFQGLHQALAALRPGIEAIFNSIAAAIVTLQPSITGVGTAISTIAIAIAPTIEILAEMANAVIPALVGGFSMIISSLSGVIPMVIAFGVAFKVLTSVSTIIMSIAAGAVRLGESLGMMALAFGASGTAAQAFATAGAVVGRALAQVAYLLPGVGLAILAAVVMWDTLGSHAEENANKVIKGSMSMGAAVADQQHQIESVGAAAEAYGRAIGGLEPTYQAATTSAKANAQATQEVEAAYQAARAQLTPMAALQADVTRAENEYQRVLQDSGHTQEQLASAGNALMAAKQALSAATDANTAAMRTNTDALKENADQAMAAANADVAAERSNLALERQQERTTAILKKAKPGSDEARQAVTDLKAAYLDAAQAASRVAAEQAAQTGVSNTSGIAASALKDKLLEFAKTAPPLVAAELRKTAEAINTNKQGMSDATVSAEAYKTTLSGIAAEAGGPLAQKIRALIPNFDSLGGAHATAEQKAKAQAAALRELANGAAPDVARQLNEMAAALEALPPSKSITVVSLSDEAKNKLTDLGITVTTLPNGQVEIDLRDEAARGRLEAFLAQTSNQTVLMLLDMDPSGAMGTINAAVAAANGAGPGIISLDGDPALVNGKVQQAVTFADGSHGTITIDGNPDPATGKITAVIQYGNGTPTTITINPRDLVTPVINRLKQPTESVHTIRVVYSVAGRPRVMSNSGGIAGGGVVGYKNGGIVQPVRANQGFVLPGYSPGRDTVPAILSPGEAVLVPELVRQIGARNILSANAAASGRKAANIGRIPASLMNGPTDASSAAGMSRVMTTIAKSSSPDVVAAVRALGKQMASMNNRVGSMENHYNNTFQVSGSPQLIASAVGQRQRAEAELGGFRGR